jgi:hypothetical protein
MGLAVIVVFAVGLVVLGVVGNEVVQCEAVVGGDEVDGCHGTPPGTQPFTWRCGRFLILSLPCCTLSP